MSSLSSLTGLSFALGLKAEGQPRPLRFVAAEGRTPSLMDDRLPGVIAAAWLEPMHVAAGGRLLLGYVELASRGRPAVSLEVFGVTADGDNGRAVPLSFPAVRAQADLR